MKKHISLLLVVSILITIIQPLVVSAYEFDGLDFGSGTYDDPIRYRDFRDYLEFNRDYALKCPTASFDVTVSGKTLNSSQTEITAADGVSADNPLYALVGDTAAITSTSKASESKYALDMFDWQATFRAEGTSTYVMKEQSNSSTFSPKTFTFDAPGAYNFYLNVRDNMPHDLVDGWGNWASNGEHEVIWNNPGSKWEDTTDDCYGLWYYAQVQVIVKEKSFSVEEKHIDRNTGEVLYYELHKGIKSDEYTTTEKTSDFTDYSFIASRAGYNFETDIANGEDEYITTRTSVFDISHTYAYHYYYYQKNTPPPPPPPGTADIYVYYKDKATGTAVHPADETTYKGIEYGTYTIAAPVVDGYTLDTATTPSPHTVTVDATNNSKVVAFLYNAIAPAPANEPPVAVVTGPEQQMAGENVSYYGNSSYDKDGTISQYSWLYPDANFVSTSVKGDRLTVWYPYVGNYTRHEKATLTVTDDKGDTDSDSHSLEILPPVPVAALNTSGIYKENRIVTHDASASYSPARYPINGYNWTITNSTNVKSVAPLNGNSINNVIYKYAGIYDNTVTTPNTVGLSDSETKSVTIVPDQKPNANFAVATKILREPSDANNATITVTNTSSSPDGDTIKKAVLLCAYDSDNDSNFDEEPWYYSTGGTTTLNPNLLSNGDAEQITTLGALTNWKTWASTPTATTFTKRTTDPWKINGASSFEIMTQPNANYTGVYYTDVPGIAGSSYSFVGKMGTHRCQGYYYINAMNSSGTTLGTYASAVVNNNSAVQNLSINFTAPANTTSLRVHIVKGNTSGYVAGYNEYVFADDLILNRNSVGCLKLAGLSYAQIPASFDIYNLVASNPATFTIRTSQVGKYKFELMTIEDIPAADTIPELLTPSDYKRGNTFTTKPNTQKIVDVINTAPTVSFEVKKKKEVDILIATDYTEQKLADLQAALNVQKANLLAKNIDVRYTIVNTTAAVAHINDAQYWFRRYGRYDFIADKYIWYTFADAVRVDDAPFQDTVIWEETTALESEARYLPLRTPTNLRWSKGALTYEDEPDVSTPSWERYYYLVNIQVDNDGYKNSGVIDFTRNKVNGLHSISGLTSGYDYSNIINEKVSVDAGWHKEEKIADVTVNVNSINFASITSSTLRTNSDRYLIFIGDSSSKVLNNTWGTYFPFGGLTKTEQDYIKANNIKPYIVTPSASLDTTLGPDKAVSMFSGDMTYYKSTEGKWNYITGTYPVEISLDADIKEVRGNYILLTNGVLKYGAGTTVATDVTGFINNSWVATSTQIKQITNGAVSRTLNFTGVLDVKTIDAYPEDFDVLIIKQPNATTAVFPNNSTMLLEASGLKGVLTDVYVNGFSDHYRDFYNYNNGRVEIIEFYYISTKHTYGANIYSLEVYENDTYKPFPYAVKFAPGWQFNNTLYKLLNTGSDTFYYSSGHIYAKMYYFATVSTNTIDVIQDLLYVGTDGNIKVPYLYRTSYNTYTQYVVVPQLKGKTIKQVFYDTVAGYTLILTSDGLLFKYISDPNVKPTPTPVFEQISNVVDLYKLKGSTYNTFKYYYLDTSGVLRNVADKTIFYSDLSKVSQNTTGDVLYVLTNDNKIFSLNFNSTAPSTTNLITTRIIINDTTKQYITLRDILNNVPDTKYYSTGLYQSAITDITNIYMNDTSYTTNYILVNDDVKYNVFYSDYENDAKYTDNWTYNHNQYYFDNSMGLASFNGQTLATPITRFDRKGQYTINVKSRDNPKNNILFDNYRLWSTGIQNILLYVHEKPIALQRITVVNNGNGTFTVKAFDAGSYDLDHTSRVDKGIAAREWRWKESTSTIWTTGQMNKTDCTADKSYITQLRVKDVEGIWSDYNTITIDKDNPPAALFSIDKRVISTTELLKVKDQSFPQSFSSITKWHWIVKKYNSDGTLPTTNLQNSQYTNSNNGTGSMLGYDVNVKTNYSTSGPGKYKIYLRVKDSNGLWSDGGTDAAPNLNYFYSQDIIVDKPPTARFSIDVNPISTTEILKLKDLSYTNGITPITRWNWIVKKLNADGSVPSTNIQNGIFTNSNNGTGTMVGYDVNVKTNYSDTGVGKYRLYLRVANANGFWSDGGTDSTVNLGSSFYIDLEVKNSLEIKNAKISGYWNHWRGQVDIFGKQLTVEPHRFLSLEKVKITADISGGADKVVIEFSPELEAMQFTDPNGTIYNYSEMTNSIVNFPADSTITLNPAITDNNITWEYILPLAPSTKSWDDVRKRAPYRMTVTAWKGTTSVTAEITDIDITANTYDLIYIQPK